MPIVRIRSRGPTGALVALLALGLRAPAPVAAQRVQLLVPLAELERRAQQDSNDAVAQYDLALGYWVNRRYDEAERALRESLVIEPRTAAAYLALSYLPYARRPQLWDEIPDGKVPEDWIERVDSALHQRARAFLLDPMVDLKILGVALPEKDIPKLKAWYPGWFVALLRGFEFFWNGQYPEAYRSFDRAMTGSEEHRKRDADSYLLWYHGLAAAHAGFHDSALEDFRILLARADAKERSERASDLSWLVTNDYRYMLASILAGAARSDSAIALFQLTLERDLSLYAAHSQLASIYEGRHQWANAIQERRRALETNPGDPVLLFDLGETLLSAGSGQEAYAVLLDAEKANPRNPRIPYALGTMALQYNEPETAKKHFTRFLEIAPTRFATQVARVRERLARIQ